MPALEPNDAPWLNFRVLIQRARQAFGANAAKLEGFGVRRDPRVEQQTSQAWALNQDWQEALSAWVGALGAKDAALPKVFERELLSEPVGLAKGCLFFACARGREPREAGMALRVAKLGLMALPTLSEDKMMLSSAALDPTPFHSWCAVALKAGGITRADPLSAGQRAALGLILDLRENLYAMQTPQRWLSGEKAKRCRERSCEANARREAWEVLALFKPAPASVQDSFWDFLAGSAEDQKSAQAHWPEGVGYLRARQEALSLSRDVTPARLEPSEPARRSARL